MGEPSYAVYKHTAPNGKVYIGITSKKPEARWNNGRAYWQNKHFTNAIKHYGWESFEHEILYSGLNKSKACELERKLIAEHKSNNCAFGYNLSSGGENPCEGVKMSEDTKRKMSEARRGKKRPESGQAISRAKKGRSNGLEGHTGSLCKKSGIVSQIDEKTGDVVRTFYGYNEMHRMTGFAKTPVKEAAAGIRKRAYGYVWTYHNRGTLDVTI